MLRAGLITILYETYTNTYTYSQTFTNMRHRLIDYDDCMLTAKH